MPEPPMIYVIDDEPAILRVIQTLLVSHGYVVHCYGSAREFLEVIPPGATGCVITDLQMPGIAGAELQQQLIARFPGLAVIVVSGTADVATAVKVMENGAVTVVQKPFTPAALVQAVKRALLRQASAPRERIPESVVRLRLAELTDEERQVLKWMIQGAPNKRIVSELQLSARTVDRRRASVLNKMGVDSTPELAAMVANLVDW